MKQAALLLLLGGSLHAMTVEDAYRAIPHRRTVFDARGARMPAADATRLAEFFELVDQAIVEQVETRLWLSTGGRDGRRLSRDGRRLSRDGHALKRLNAFRPPAGLGEVHRLVREAVQDQRTYLEQAARGMEKGRSFVFSARAPLVRSASRKLHAAYDALLKVYPGETDANKQAFFDCLCALDFM